MAAINLWRNVVFIMMYAVMVISYPDGAPDSACITLIPDSHGPTTATGPSPYFIRLSSTTYTENQVITVILSGGLFKGFLVVGAVVGVSRSVPVGFFQNPDVDTILSCVGFPFGNGITQSNNTVKHSVSLQWRAPTTAVGNIHFHYTVIRGNAPSTKITPNDYFDGLYSQIITPVTDGFPVEKQNQEKTENKNRGESFESVSFEEVISRSKPKA